MIYAIPDLSHPLASYLKDDPVRPHIPHEQRFGTHAQVFALTENDTVKAMVCAKFCKGVPSSEQELLDNSDGEPDTAVFYTIWSYTPGAGQRLIREALKQAQKDLPNVKKFVTLSPPTEMARRFHTKNGASVFRINSDTVNYEYIQY
jgi:hypothetical protein